jgi:hypothetical protein
MELNRRSRPYPANRARAGVNAVTFRTAFALSRMFLALCGLGGVAIPEVFFCRRAREVVQRGAGNGVDGTGRASQPRGSVPTCKTLTLAPASVPKHFRGFLFARPSGCHFAWQTLDTDERKMVREVISTCLRWPSLPPCWSWP